MDRHPTDVAVFHRLGQGLDGKILGALAGIEAAAAQINGVRTVFHSGPQGLHGPGGSQQFQHKSYLT